MNVVILGCGRVGALIADELDEQHAVTVIDWNPESFRRLSGDYSGETVVCNGIDVECLRSAGVDAADVFVAVTDGDNRNLMAAQVATRLGVAKSIARVYDPERCAIFAEMGLTTISPTVEGADRLFAMAVAEKEQ